MPPGPDGDLQWDARSTRSSGWTLLLRRQVNGQQLDVLFALRRRIGDGVARLMPGKGQTQRTVGGQRLIFLTDFRALRNFVDDGDHPHCRDIPVREPQRDCRPVWQQSGCRVPRSAAQQESLEFGDPTIDERDFLGLLNFVGGVATITDRILVAFQAGQRPLTALPQSGQLLGDAVSPFVRKCRGSASLTLSPTAPILKRAWSDSIGPVRQPV